MKHSIVLLLMCVIGCTTKPDVIVIDDNTYYFEEGVENFYIVCPDGTRQEITDGE